METQTVLIAAGLAILLLAFLFAGSWIRSYLGAKRWSTAVNYAWLVVNAVDQQHHTGDIEKDDRLQAAMDQLLDACPWLKSVEAHTIIHGWLGVINAEKATMTNTDAPLYPAPTPEGITPAILPRPDATL